MQLVLEKRAEPSRSMALLSPLLAIALTMLTRCHHLRRCSASIRCMRSTSIFIEPLSAALVARAAGVKAAPLILIAVGLSVCYRANVWNIGAEGQFTVGAIFGSACSRSCFPSGSSRMIAAADAGRSASSAAWPRAPFPALLKNRFSTNEILTSLMLVYVAQLVPRLAGARALARSRGLSISRRPCSFSDWQLLPVILRPARASISGVVFAVIAACWRWLSCMAAR